MSFETEDDRLEMIKALGGQLITVEGGEFWAIFNAAYREVLVNELDGGVETTGPALTCRTSDLVQLSIQKSTLIPVGADQFRVRRPEPDGTGMTLVRLTRV